MLTPRRALIPFALVLLISMIIGGEGLAETHRQHTYTRCCIPGHRYTHDDREVSNRVITIADPVRAVTWHNPDRTLQRKVFHFPVRSLAANQVRLENVGLTLYSDGRLSATGRLIHDGGSQGDLLGNRVIIRLQAYAGLAGQRGELANAPVVWQTEKRLLISRDRPQVISLAGYENRLAPANINDTYQKEDYREKAAWTRLREQFDEITHLEVELAYLGDR